MIAGIEADARKEQEQALAEAEAVAAEKKKYAEQKVASILNDARRKAGAEAEVIKRKALSGVELEVKRRALHVRDTLMKDIMAKVEARCASMIGKPEYRAVLIEWIAEAGVGLQAEAAAVNASEAERKLIDAPLLAEARKKIKARTGQAMMLTLAESEPLTAQGVVLTTTDRRVAFNNQVHTRIARKQRQIQMLIYNAVFSGS